MRLQEKFKICRAQGQGLLATNFYNFETLKGVLLAAQKCHAPLILQLTKSSIDYMGLENAVALARAGLKSYGVEGWLHLDHSTSVDLVEKCLAAGFDSVMIDASEKPFAENVATTKIVMAMAEKYGAHVEAELGYVAKLGQSTDRLELTDPADAQRFVAETGVHSLAVAIGNAHGFYKQEPNLDFDRLRAIQQVTPAYLVLHGSSGIPDKQLRRAVDLGIVKVNLATELKNAFMMAVKSLMATSEDIDLRQVFPPAIQAVQAIAEHKLHLLEIPQPGAESLLTV